MNKKETDRIKGQIHKKIRKGDYVTLGEMLIENQETARTKYRRGKPEAVLAMQKIVSTRESLVSKYRNYSNTEKSE